MNSRLDNPKGEKVYIESWRDFHLSKEFQKVSDVGEGEYESATGKIQRIKAFDFDQVYPVSSFLIIGGAIKNLQTYEKSPSWGGGISTENKIVPHPPKTRASRTTGAKGSNYFARNNRERIKLQVSVNNM